MASVWTLPIVFICENNNYAMWTPSSSVTSIENISDRAAAYGMPGVCVDGMDLLAVRSAARAAIERARAGLGPTLLEAKTYRFCGHSKSENGKGYRPSEEIAAWELTDPIPRWRAKLIVDGVPAALLDRIDIEVDAEIEAATQFALESPYASDEALENAYAPAALPGDVAVMQTATLLPDMALTSTALRGVAA